MRTTAVLCSALMLLLVTLAGAFVPDAERAASPTTVVDSTTPAPSGTVPVAAPVVAATPVEADPGSEIDYSGELPRISPKSPEQALAAFRLRPGFHVELVAAEPLLRDPVALDFDEDGRMYVAEFAEYNQYANPAAQARGTVKLLEDYDGDGVYETAHPFLDPIGCRR